MLPQALVIGACILWVLVCMRFYIAISAENVWQRRFIAIAAGLGAALVYTLGSMIVPLLKPGAEPPPVERAEDVRVKAK